MGAVKFKDSDETFFTECDNCNDAVGSLVVWKEKDFAICMKCLTELSEKYIFPIMKQKEFVTTRRKTISEELREAVMQKSGGVCEFCGSGHLPQIDHIKPFVCGGKTTIDNLRILCRSCNLSRKIQYDKE